MAVDPKDVDRTRTVGTKPGATSAPESTEAASTGAGKHFGRFELRERIGQGGMGVVYRATDKMLSRDVAIKVLGPGAASPERRLRLQREAQAMAALSHPNLVTVYEAGIDGEELFIAMEYVRGQTLSQWLKAGPHPWSEVLRVMIEAGRGLAAAHAADIVHRDFKPSNVLVGQDGRVQVADFGIALTGGPDDDGTASETTGDVKLTKTGVALGTPKYMSPEQHEARKVDARSDQFSFALTLAEAVYGEHPFAAKNYRQLVQNVLTGDPELPASRGPAGLARILRRGLARNRADRYGSMAELLAELEALQKPRGMVLRATGITLGLIAIGVIAVVLGRSTGADMVVATAPAARVDTEDDQADDTEPTPTTKTAATKTAALTTAIDAGTAAATTSPADASARPSVSEHRPRKRKRRPRTRRPETTPQPSANATPDAGPPAITTPAARIGIMVYTKKRCAVDHANKTCSKCCKTGRWDAELLMPYPNCGCYYDERARAAAEAKRRYFEKTPRRIGRWSYVMRCAGWDTNSCRNCCGSSLEFFKQYCACYKKLSD